MSHNHNHTQTKNIKVALFLNLGFVFVEIAGAILTNSVSIMADAIHDLGDTLSLALSLFFAKVSEKKRTERFSYGYKRFSLLAALINGVVLVVGALFILTQAIPRLFSPENTNYKGMIVLSLIGVTINFLAFWKTNKGSTLNERVVTLHLLEDVLGWVAVLLISIVGIFTGIYVLDPMLAILINIMIFYQAYKAIKETVVVFLQGIPAELDIEELKSKILKIQSIVDIHDVHVWSLDGDDTIFSAHLVIEGSNIQKNIKSEVKQLLASKHIHHSTLEFEQKDEGCEQQDC